MCALAIFTNQEHERQGLSPECRWKRMGWDLFLNEVQLGTLYQHLRRNGHEGCAVGLTPATSCRISSQSLPGMTPGEWKNPQEFNRACLPFKKNTFLPIPLETAFLPASLNPGTDQVSLGPSHSLSWRVGNVLNCSHPLHWPFHAPCALHCSLHLRRCLAWITLHTGQATPACAVFLCRLAWFIYHYY